ncbi:MAG TPA: BlaI/MecI/CopY family transcriptional regulator [Candidatus Elarobacter sp.]|jgi:predicted transcriptional regulator|nr:BlaI/MecI/CopY family transcriptional regulator [Candidatus Elarobacter sp.]
MARRGSPVLTDAELRLMEVLWRTPDATVNDVVESVGAPPLSYSTVLTTLRILERKGYVAHDEVNRAYVYRPLVARDEAASKDVGHVLKRFFAGKPLDLAMRLVEHDRPSREELQRLRALIDRYEEDAR